MVFSINGAVRIYTLRQTGTIAESFFFSYVSALLPKKATTPPKPFIFYPLFHYKLLSSLGRRMRDLEEITCFLDSDSPENSFAASLKL